MDSRGRKYPLPILYDLVGPSGTNIMDLFCPGSDRRSILHRSRYLDSCMDIALSSMTCISSLGIMKHVGDVGTALS